MEDAKAPEPEKMEEIKRYTFTKIIQSQEVTPQGPKIDEQKPDKEKESTKLDFALILYRDGIAFDVKEIKEERKTPVAIYETLINLETLKSLCNLFNKLNAEKIWELIQKSFEMNYDNISVEEEGIKIKLMINIMDVITEEISFTIPKIQFTKEEEVETLKESIKILDNEKNSLKKEVKDLNILVEELKKKIEEKNNEQQNKGKELQSKIEKQENEFNSKIEENDNTLKNTIEQEKNSLKNMIEEKDNTLKNTIEQEKNSLKNMIEEKDNALKTMIENIMKEMEGLKKVEKYAKEKIIIEDVDEKEKKKYIFSREFQYDGKDFKEEITMILLEKTIKFRAKETQDSLKCNYSIYESSFKFEDFGEISNICMNKGVEAIYTFMSELFDGKKDKIIKGENKIVIKAKFPVGNRDGEISLDVRKKEIGLENTLNNISNTLKEINSNNINTQKEFNEKLSQTNRETKNEFNKKLLEKVYPIGSYYWSSKDISPQNIFGGIWERVYGRFLFASDSSHPVGYCSGEERHTLTISEMPSHSHGYMKFNHNNFWHAVQEGDDYFMAPTESDRKFLISATTDSYGGGSSHNNMPPYVAANCWKRTG